jgi:ArsR family transcriptional regulator
MDLDPCCPPAELAPSADGLSRHAAFLRALADPTRLTMLELLARAKSSLCACEIEARFPLSQPTISHHLRILRQAGLVRCERRGTWMHYRLQPEALSALRRIDAEVEQLSRSREGEDDG